MSGCVSNPNQENAVEVTEETNQMTGTEEYTGHIYVNDVNGATFHTYVSYTGDASSLIETDDTLILIDAQSTHSSSAELNNYIETLNKPLKQVLVPSHGLGLAYYEGTPVAASEQMNSFMESEGPQVFIGIFKGIFEDDLDDRIVPIDPSLEEGENTIEGVRFTMTTHENDFPPVSDLEFTEYNVLFTHLTAYDSHMLVSSKDQIDELKNYWTNARSKNYELILSSHLMPVDAKAIEFQLEYLDVLENASQSASQEEFMEAMQTAYPDAGMPQFLGMTAENFYGQ
jgi:hypothetical protein